MNPFIMNCFIMCRQQAPNKGHFDSRYSLMDGMFIHGSREFVLRSSIAFHSAKYWNPETASYTWIVPAGTTVDGASIPKACWSIIGGPYSGTYRLSSAIHDYLCARGLADEWAIGEAVGALRVHRLFAEMIESEGVTGWKLYAMTKAVKYGGPRW